MQGNVLQQSLVRTESFRLVLPPRRRAHLLSGEAERARPRAPGQQ
jgi:hypothetical protein